MGFYAPAQIVQDARRHGVEMMPADVTVSDWDCTLNATHQPGEGQPALRLGLRMVSGISTEGASRIVKSREQKPFDSVEDLAIRCVLDKRDLKSLAAAGALSILAGQRRQALSFPDSCRCGLL